MSVGDSMFKADIRMLDWVENHSTHGTDPGFADGAAVAEGAVQYAAAPVPHTQRTVLHGYFVLSVAKCHKSRS